MSCRGDPECAERDGMDRHTVGGGGSHVVRVRSRGRAGQGKGQMMIFQYAISTEGRLAENERRKSSILRWGWVRVGPVAATHLCGARKHIPFASSTGGEWELAIIWARVAMPNFQRPGLSGACLAVVVKGAVDRAGTGRKVDDDTYGCRTDVYLGKRGSE